MSDGLRKVVHIEVFDFECDGNAYAINTKKNQFGYKYRTQYMRRGEVVKEIPEINNVEIGAEFYNKFGINISQLRSLRRKVKEITKKRMIPFNEKDYKEVLAKSGSSITYKGKYREDFYQKVLKIK